jgi:hypothetical protein
MSLTSRITTKLNSRAEPNSGTSLFSRGPSAGRSVSENVGVAVLLALATWRDALDRGYPRLATTWRRTTSGDLGNHLLRGR